VTVARILDESLSALLAHEAELGRLDAVAGDGDHGIGMVRGMRAAVAAAGDGPPGATLAAAGAAFADAAGGASGALVGTLLETTGRTLQDAGEPVGARAVGSSLAAGLAALQALGGAQPGDKTMVDTLHPFVAALNGAAEAGAPLPRAWSEGVAAARAGAESTHAMASRRGRAARVGTRGDGSHDPGAMSVLLCLEAAGTVIEADCE
jgi:dihydroxyacetone kinase